MNDLKFFAIGIFIGVIIFILVVTFGSQKSMSINMMKDRNLYVGKVLNGGSLF